MIKIISKIVSTFVAVMVLAAMHNIGRPNTSQIFSDKGVTSSNELYVHRRGTQPRSAGNEISGFGRFGKMNVILGEVEPSIAIGITMETGHEQ